MADNKNKGNGKVLVAGALGTGLGIGIGTALSRKGAAAAETPPTDDSAVLAAISTKLDNILTAIKNISISCAGGGGAVVVVQTPWIAGDPIEIFDDPIRDIVPHNCNTMADLTQGKRAEIQVESSLDQAVSIQAIGCMDNNDFAHITAVGLPVVCPVGGTASIGIDGANWRSFIGTQALAAVAPTQGLLKVRVRIQS
jgi:hypothetical protein